VDAFHREGIGVILDWVPAHFPKDDFALARFDGTPLYEDPDPLRGEHPDWGTYVFNFGRNEVRNFLVANALYWLQEFNIDGIRGDAVAPMLYARSIGVEVHLSTQLNITNVEALRFYAQFADVVVLARELNMDQVAAIHKAIIEEPIVGPAGEPIRIEMFAHGALCMAVSGKCYLSLHEQGKSANRGSCSQICRRSYEVKDKETGIELEIDNQYIMSPKDLKTIHFLNKMLDAGVRVLKIEGRARGPEYVDTVVRAYREAVDTYCAGNFTTDNVEKWDNHLGQVFNRGFWDGYYLGQRLGEWTSSYGSSATKQKVYVAKTTKYFGKVGVGEFAVESGELKVGDEIIITGPTTGLVRFVVEEIRVDMEPVEKAVKGQLCSIAVPEKVRPGDRLYLFTDRKVTQ